MSAALQEVTSRNGVLASCLTVSTHSDPIRFLFNREIISDGENGQLLFRKHTLYGREKEISLITDTFVRVSTGKCEAFFIGGFSGELSSASGPR